MLGTDLRWPARWARAEHQGAGPPRALRRPARRGQWPVTARRREASELRVPLRRLRRPWGSPGGQGMCGTFPHRDSGGGGKVHLGLWTLPIMVVVILTVVGYCICMSFCGC